MFKLNKRIIFGIGFILLIVVVISLDRLFKKPLPNPIANPINTSTTTEPEAEKISQQQIHTPYSANSAPEYTGRPIDEVRFGAGFQAPTQLTQKHKNNLVILKKTLTGNPVSSLNDWLTVGIIKKFFNDYEGARDAWEYASILYPSNGMVFSNLGNLYGFYLHDNQKAEFNLKKAIANDPYQPSYYIGLADFYKVVDASKKGQVPEVILSGLDKIKDINLYLYLASYYMGIGDKANALKYYQEVLKISPDQAGIQEEIGRLK